MRVETIYGPADGFVYFAAIGGARPTHVKIGYTAHDPSSRLRGLQTGCPFKIDLLGYVPGTVSHEAELHDVLARDRCGGEWFVWTDHVERVVAAEVGAWANG